MKQKEGLLRSSTVESVAAAKSVEPVKFVEPVEFVEAVNPDEDSDTASSFTPYLLTPGPLTTTAETRTAMNTDWGSWDTDFNQLTAGICRKLEKIAGGENRNLRCVPLQGSGTFAVEAALRTVVPRGGTVIVLVNGAYGHRMAALTKLAGRNVVLHETAQDTPPDPADITRLAAQHPEATHVAIVHCETSTGLLNPLLEIADAAQDAGLSLIVDAMSSFGALDVGAQHPAIVAIVAASGKCLEGVPGMGFVLLPETVIQESDGNCDSLVLDLVDQYQYLQRTGQWRFTPPTHVVAALHAALRQYEAQGGREARLRRYQENGARLLADMTQLGFRSYLPPDLQAPIIYTFHAPQDTNWDFPSFYREVKDCGFILYPGKLTEIETFRVGCIGAVDAQIMSRAVEAISESLQALNIDHI